MGILSLFRKPPAQNALSTSKSFFWGGSTSGTLVNEKTAMQTAAVYACVRVISVALACLPLNVYRYQNNGVQITPNHHLYNVLHNEPNPEMTSFVFRETLMSHLLLYGNAFAQIIRNGAGQVTALYPLMPAKVDVYRNPDNGQIFYTYFRDRDESRQSRDASGGVSLLKDEVLHIPGLNFDGLIGYSPIALAKNAIGMAIVIEDYGASFFANNANPGGILEHPGTLKNPEQIRAAWESLYKGSRHSHRIAVLEEGLKFHMVSVPPDQAQFLETRKF